jgi:ribosome-associated toxin RatA of RatAB toxin-antitoxin module
MRRSAGVDMPVIENRVSIQAPPDLVMEIAMDTEKFPEFMPDVKEIHVLERSEDRRLERTRWVGRIPQFGLTVTWLHKTIWNFEERRADFEQEEGEFDAFKGFWQFVPEDGGTLFISEVDYVYHVPLIGALAQKVVHHLMKQNVVGIMNAIKERSEEEFKRRAQESPPELR